MFCRFLVQRFFYFPFASFIPFLNRSEKSLPSFWFLPQKLDRMKTPKRALTDFFYYQVHYLAKLPVQFCYQVSHDKLSNVADNSILFFKNFFWVLKTWSVDAKSLERAIIEVFLKK